MRIRIIGLTSRFDPIIRINVTDYRISHMTLADMHPEDIKASIRKRFGTIRNFELANDLPKGSVHEVLRRRRWARIERAIESVILRSPSEKTDSKRERGAHRLSAGAK